MDLHATRNATPTCRCLADILDNECDEHILVTPGFDLPGVGRVAPTKRHAFHFNILMCIRKVAIAPTPTF